MAPLHSAVFGAPAAAFAAPRRSSIARRSGCVIILVFAGIGLHAAE